MSESYLYKDNIILFKKFSQLDGVAGKYNNIKLFDDTIIVLQKMPTYLYDKKITERDINFILSKIEKYKIIIIADGEHILLEGWLDLLKRINELNKIVFLETFTIGVKHYIDKKVPNNKIYVNGIKNIFNFYYNDLNNFQRQLHNITDKRQFLLKHFSYNRSPQRDFITDFLINKNLIDNNNISFHNYPFEKLNDDLDLKTANITYSFYEVDILLKNVDIKRLNNLKIIPESENFNIQNQSLQFNKGTLANISSYFEIVSEAQTPISENPESYFHYTYSITRRTFNPILYGNVFHIMPHSTIFENDLKNVGIELFFKNDEDFLNNLNEDFYFDTKTQYKLKHNFELLKNFSKERKRHPWYLDEIEHIYSVKFE